MTDWLMTTLADLAGTPALLFAMIFLLTFVLEDAVAVAAGILAGRMAIDPVIAVAALVVGTVAGDLALYAAGRWLAETRIVARLRAAGSGRIEARLRKDGLWVVGLARFIPGTRLPVFLGSGIVRTPLFSTTAVVVVTTLVWTPGLFWVSFGAGEHVFAMLTPATLTAAAAMVLAAFFAPRLVRNLVPAANRAS
jgi:membrane protein DedA with SNARE-associated domain